jgi:hypothetical protein
LAVWIRKNFGFRYFRRTSCWLTPCFLAAYSAISNPARGLQVMRCVLRTLIGEKA